MTNAIRRQNTNAEQTNSIGNPLKGLCHKDFAVLVQFCAKIILSYTNIKNYKVDIKLICQGELTIIILLLTFVHMASKLEKNWPNFFKFQSISILFHPQQQTTGNSFSAKIVFNNKSRPLFLEFN